MSAGPSAVRTRAVVLVLLAWVFQRRLSYLPSREPVPAAA